MQCILWHPQIYWLLDVHILLWEAYRRNMRALLRIRQCTMTTEQEWKWTSTNKHCIEQWNARPIVEDLNISLCRVAPNIDVSPWPEWRFTGKDLRLYTYKLQIATELSELHQVTRLRFTCQPQRELNNDSGYLERITYLMNISFRSRENSRTSMKNAWSTNIWGC